MLMFDGEFNTLVLLIQEFIDLHKPTVTIKNILCSKAKDRLHSLDKPGVIYAIQCQKHDGLYVGQTGRAAKDRFYKHRVINHHDAKRSYLLGEN